MLVVPMLNFNCTHFTAKLDHHGGWGVVDGHTPAYSVEFVQGRFSLSCRVCFLLLCFFQVFMAVQKAYDTLTDTQKRRAYDSSLEFDDSIPGVHLCIIL